MNDENMTTEHTILSRNSVTNVRFFNDVVVVVMMMMMKL
jgi:hypothetical protein